MTLVGVLVLTPDGLLIRLLSLDAWTLVFWRGALMVTGSSLLLFAIYRHKTVDIIRKMGWAGLLIAFLHACSTICYTMAISYTVVAKALVILATVPLFASIFSFFILKERLLVSTSIVISLSFLGILIVVSDHLGQASGTILGDSCALAAAIFMALVFTLIRRKRDVNMVPAMSIGYAISALLVLPMTSSLSLTSSQLPLMLLLGLFILPISFSLIAHGPRYISAAEVSLLMLLETVLGPVWVWLVINERPNETTLIGGFLIISSIATYSFWRLYQTEAARER